MSLTPTERSSTVFHPSTLFLLYASTMPSSSLFSAYTAAILLLPTFKISKSTLLIRNRSSPPKSSRSIVLRAMREWREYEDAVREKDLARALRFLKESVPNSAKSSASSTSMFCSLELSGLEKDWEVLDTCLNADDMRLVGSAYAFLKDRGLLEGFGKCRNIGKVLAGLKHSRVYFG